VQSFEDNSTLEGVLTDLIIPSVKSKELEIREKGLVCLGLCCLIAKVRPQADSPFSIL
jgi:condensin complex subunit 3